MKQEVSICFALYLIFFFFFEFQFCASERSSDVQFQYFDQSCFFLSVILSVMWKFPPELQRFSDVITTAVFFGQGCEMSVLNTFLEADRAELKGH